VLAANDEYKDTQYYPIDYARLTGEQLVKSSGKLSFSQIIIFLLNDPWHSSKDNRVIID